MKIDINEDPSFDDVELSIRCPRIDSKVRSIIAAAEASDRRLIGIEGGFVKPVASTDVLYAELVDGRTFLYTDTSVLESPSSLTAIEEQLEGAGFVRATRQLIVNLMHVSGMRPYLNARLELVMDNGEHIIASRQYAPGIKDRIGL